jgi:ADP-ribose pyrophosphatase YjhB (NUDIX family)
LDWGATPQADLPREIREEMGLAVTSVAANPSYFITDQTMNRKVWFANVLYETTLENLDFTPSDECINIRFVNKNDLQNIKAFPSVKKLAEMFRTENHAK